MKTDKCYALYFRSLFDDSTVTWDEWFYPSTLTDKYHVSFIVAYMVLLYIFQVRQRQYDVVK